MGKHLQDQTFGEFWYATDRESEDLGTNLFNVSYTTNVTNSGSNPFGNVFFFNDLASESSAGFSYQDTALENLEEGLNPLLIIVNWTAISEGFIEIEWKDSSFKPKIFAPRFTGLPSEDALLSDLNLARQCYLTCRDVIEKAKELAPGHTYQILNPSQEAFDAFDSGDEEALDSAIFNYLIQENHGVGTCKMGFENDDTSVVNENFHVKGVKHLMVADASILPAAVNTSTAFTTSAIGVMAVQIINEEKRMLNEEEC